jgi:hypothetical protein
MGLPRWPFGYDPPINAGLWIQIGKRDSLRFDSQFLSVRIDGPNWSNEVRIRGEFDSVSCEFSVLTSAPPKIQIAGRNAAGIRRKDGEGRSGRSVFGCQPRTGSACQAHLRWRSRPGGAVVLLLSGSLPLATDQSFASEP